MEPISKELFQKEIDIYKQLSKENGNKCNWGECDNCCVIPLLYKKQKGILLEDEQEIKYIKKKNLK